MMEKIKRVAAIFAIFIFSFSSRLVAEEYTEFTLAKSIEAEPTQAEVMNWKNLAEQDDAQAQYNLGVIYSNGIGVPENDKKAVFWYRKAADKGHLAAKVNLGVMYDHGDGTPEDDVGAAELFKAAAELGDADAQYNLGVMYALDRAALFNKIYAYMWFNLAAAERHEVAKILKDKIETIMPPEDVLKAQKLSLDCLAKNYKNCGY